MVLSTLAAVAFTVLPAGAKEITLLNVSYDPTRELYKDVNTAFARSWEKKTGDRVTVQQSHSGSGKQARAVIEGLQADVVTLALAYDIDVIAEKAKLLSADWQKRLPNHSSPFVSTVVFLVRKGNPKGIKDWDDLVKPGISVITPNPKTSGGARWNYLAAWGFALKKYGPDEARARDFVARLFANVPIMDTGARGATGSFLQHGLGDVLVAWENEAMLAMRESARDKVEIVYPSYSILAEPPVAWVDTVVAKRGTAEVAQGYLEFLYSAEGQQIGAKHYYRPRLESVAQEFASTFPKINTFTIEDVFGGWQKAQKQHFGDGGVFDQMQQSKR
jgi:sulfate/thiosulfate transport system substrate-binding protein